MLALASGQDSCEYIYDGGAIDLSALGYQNYQVMQSGNSSLYFRPCNRMTYDDIMPEGNPYCNTMAYACRLLNNVPHETVGEHMSGTTDGVTTTVNITRGDYCPAFDTYRTMTIELTCGPDIGAPVFVSEIGCHYSVSWQSSAACPRTAFPKTPFPPGRDESRELLESRGTSRGTAQIRHSPAGLLWVL